MRHFPLIAGALGALLIVWGEFVNWRSSRRLVGMPGSHRLVDVERSEVEAVIVLGFRDGGERANAINRWRVRAGLRSIDPDVARSWLVLCGGRVHGPWSEASLMADYARRSCGYRGEIRLDERSHTTWENIENAIPLIADADRVKIVSQSLHAEKGRLYLHRQRPDLAARLVRAADYRVGEWALLKPVLAVLGLWDLSRSKRSGMRSAREPSPPDTAQRGLRDR